MRIRFGADLGEFYEENATYHMMIIPKNYLDHFNITGDYYNALLTALTNGGYNTFIATMECLHFQYTDEERAILQKFVGQAADQKNGVSEADSNAKYETV